MLTENADLNDKLRQRLEHAESDRARTREMLRQQQTKCAEFNQVLASLRSSYETKSDMLRELEREMSEIGVQADANAEERARVRRDELYNQVSHNRARINQLENSWGSASRKWIICKNVCAKQSAITSSSASRS